MATATETGPDNPHKVASSDDTLVPSVSAASYVPQRSKRGRCCCSASTLLFIASSIQMLVCSGLTLGWAGMILLLNGERTFTSLCVDDGDVGAGSGSGDGTGTCDESDLKLNFIFTVTTTSYGVAPLVLGAVIDRFGPRLMCTVSSAMLSVGFMLLALADYPSRDYFLPGFVIVGTFGVGVQFSCFHVANLFPKHHATVTSVLSAMFGVSSLMYPVLYAIWSASDGAITRAALFWAYMVFVLVCTAFSMFLPTKTFAMGDNCEFSWRRGFHVHNGPAPSPVSKVVVDGGSCNSSAPDGANDAIAVQAGAGEAGSATAEPQGATVAAGANNTPACDALGEDAANSSAATASEANAGAGCVQRVVGAVSGSEAKADGTDAVGGGQGADHGAAGERPAAAAADAAGAGSADGSSETTPACGVELVTVGMASGHDAPAGLAKHPSDADAAPAPADATAETAAGESETACQQARTPDFVLNMVFTFMTFLCVSIYLGSVNLQLEALEGSDTSADTVEWYTSTFSWIAPVGAFFSPFIGIIIDRRGFSTAYLLVGVMGVVHIVCALIPWLPLQLLTFLAYTVSQEGLFACLFAYVGARFGYGNYGQLTGYTVFFCGLANLLVFPITASVVDGFMSFRTLNLVVLVVKVLLVFTFPVYLMTGNRPTRHRALKHMATDDVDAAGSSPSGRQHINPLPDSEREGAGAGAVQAQAASVPSGADGADVGHVTVVVPGEEDGSQPQPGSEPAHADGAAGADAVAAQVKAPQAAAGSADSGVAAGDVDTPVSGVQTAGAGSAALVPTAVTV